MVDYHNVLYGHVSKTLPDSISERQLVLEALAGVLSATHPALQRVNKQLNLLDDTRKAEAELQLIFKQLEAKP